MNDLLKKLSDREKEKMRKKRSRNRQKSINSVIPNIWA